MRIHWAAACLTLGTLAIALGCGNYSAPTNPMSAPDSVGDSMAPPPQPGYLRH
jgi:hypothetical protein